RALALADGEPVDRCDCGESRNAWTIFYGGDVCGVCDCRMERRGAGDGRNVFACICFCGSDGEIFAETAEVADGRRLPGWSECSGGGVDGVCGMAIRAGDDVERDSDCNGGGCGGFSDEISGEFGVVDFGWRVGRNG